MRRHFGWIVALLAGCSEASIGNERGDSAPSEPVTISTAPDLDSGLGTATPTDSAPPSAAWYGLDLSFTIAGSTPDVPGEWQPDTATLAIALRSTAEELVCTHEVPIAVVAEEEYPDTAAALVGWWRIGTEDGVPDLPCPEWPARAWQLGLGPYDTRLDPMMAARGSLGFDVYGLYLQEEPDGPVYVVGFAGTNEMLLGEPDLTVEAEPLPDGDYRAESLVLMSLD